MNHTFLNITCICFFGIYSLHGMDTSPNTPNKESPFTNLLNSTNVDVNTTQPNFDFFNDARSVFVYNKANIPPQNLTTIKAPKKQAHPKKQNPITKNSPKKKKRNQTATSASMQALCTTFSIKSLVCDRCSKEFKNANPSYLNRHKKTCLKNLDK